MRVFKRIFANRSSSANLQFDSLDGLRGIAVSFVLLSHLSSVGFVSFAGSGKTGVFLFFGRDLEGRFSGASLPHGYLPSHSSRRPANWNPSRSARAHCSESSPYCVRQVARLILCRHSAAT